MRGPTAVIFALLLWILPVAAGARDNHAILIGASRYPSLASAYWLEGPANDVRLVREYLATVAPVPFSAENIHVLADGVAGGTPPTLAAIRAAFAAVTARLRPGDFVYVHFSGHGSQAPARKPDSEPDGLDEIFLPIDIGPWTDSTQEVANALVDDEVAAMIAAMRARGAAVWVVFDSCHSGSATRAAPVPGERSRLRRLDPVALGVPDRRLGGVDERQAEPPADPRARPESPLKAPGEASKGGLVAFFAAQTNETTPEQPMPESEADAPVRGVFTYVLFETLARNPGLSYRQLAEEVLRQYAVRGLARATPVFEGDLDRTVFLGTPAGAVRQWPVETDGDGAARIPAGRMHGLGPGDLLALVGRADAGAGAVLGYMRVTSAEGFSAAVEPVAAKGRAAPVGWPAGALLRAPAARVDYSLSVALAGSDDPEAAAAIEAAVNRIAADPALSHRIRFMAAEAAAADVRLAVVAGAQGATLQLVPANGVFDVASGGLIPAIRLAGKTAEQTAAALAGDLGRMARAIALMRVGAAVGAGERDVAISLRTRSRENRTLRPLDPVTVPRLVPGDEVHMIAENRGDLPVDLNILYVASDYSISHFFAGRLNPGERLKKGLLRITDQSFGRDHLVAVVTPARPGAMVENLSFLAQEAVPATRGTRRKGLAAVLAEAGFGLTTRGAVMLTDDSEAAAPAFMQIEIDTVPAL